MPSRRSVLVGLGGLVAGGGALIGTGAFTTVEAQREVNIDTAGDASALLALAPADRDDDRDTSEDSSTTPVPSDVTANEYVSDPGNGTISINLDGNEGGAQGLNQRAITTFRNLVEITNNGTQTITSISLEFTTVPSEIDDTNATFDFTVSTLGSGGNNNSDQVENGNEILTGGNGIPGDLSPGSSIEFGIVVDLIDGGNGSNDLPAATDGEDYLITITANTDSTSTASPPS